MTLFRSPSTRLSHSITFPCLKSIKHTYRSQHLEGFEAREQPGKLPVIAGRSKIKTHLSSFETQIGRTALGWGAGALAAMLQSAFSETSRLLRKLPRVPADWLQ